MEWRIDNLEINKLHISVPNDCSEIFVFLEKIKYITPYSAAKLYLILRKILNKNTKVQLTLADSVSDKVIDYLHNIKFFRKLDHDGNCKIFGYRDPKSLKNLSESHEIESKAQLTKILNEETKASFITLDSFSTRDKVKKLVMNELALNALEHSNSGGAITLTTEKNLDDCQLPKELVSQLKNEKVLRAYEVIVADNGIGFEKTLKNDYEANSQFQNDLNKYDAPILHYALLKNTSQKDRFVLANLDEKTPSPTGLFAICEYLKEKCGKIEIECDGFRISYTFTDRLKIIEERVDKNVGLETTIIRVLVPNKRPDLKSNSIFDLNEIEFAKVISIGRMLTISENEDAAEEKTLKKISKYINEIEIIGEKKYLLVDCVGITYSQRYFVQLICKSYRIISKYSGLFFTNVPDYIFEDKHVLSEIKNYLGRENSRSLIISNNKKVAQFNSQSVKISEMKNIEKIAEIIQNYNYRVLRTAITENLSVKRKVWIPSPTSKYISFYFNINSLLQRKLYAISLTQWLSSFLYIKDANYVITNSNPLNAFLKENAHVIGLEQSKFLVYNPHKGGEANITQKMKFLRVERNSKAIFISDVNLTGSSFIKFKKDFESHFVSVEYVSFIENTLTELPSKIYFYTKRLKTYSVKPDKWNLDEIETFDKDSHGLIKNTLPAFNSNSEEIIRKIFDSNEQSFISGHLQTAHKCYLNYVATEKLNLMSVLGNAAISNFTTLSENVLDIKSGTKVYLLDFDEYPSITKLILELKNLLKENFDVEIIKIGKSKKTATIDPDEEHSLSSFCIYLDVAFSTGHSNFKAIQWAASNQCNYISNIILLNRGINSENEKISGIRNFNGTNLQTLFLYDLKGPNYHSGDCPVCAFRAKISSVAFMGKNDTIQRTLNELYEQTKGMDVNDYKEDGNGNLQFLSASEQLIIHYIYQEDEQVLGVTKDKIESVFQSKINNINFLSQMLEVLWINSFQLLTKIKSNFKEKFNFTLELLSSNLSRVALDSMQKSKLMCLYFLSDRALFKIKLRNKEVLYDVVVCRYLAAYFYLFYNDKNIFTSSRAAENFLNDLVNEIGEIAPESKLIDLTFSIMSTIEALSFLQSNTSGTPLVASLDFIHSHLKKGAVHADFVEKFDKLFELDWSPEDNSSLVDALNYLDTYFKAKLFPEIDSIVIWGRKYSYDLDDYFVEAEYRKQYMFISKRAAKFLSSQSELFEKEDIDTYETQPITNKFKNVADEFRDSLLVLQTDNNKTKSKISELHSSLCPHIIEEVLKVFGEFEKRLSKKQIELKHKLDVYESSKVHISINHLKQTIENVCKNLLEHTLAKTYVDITAEACEVENRYTFSFENISKKEIQFVETRGLSNTKDIIRWFDGDLEIFAEPFKKGLYKNYIKLSFKMPNESDNNG